ncbi:MAG: hypothetical protein IPG53_03665 [Ignavibacteriales bacterium]|nr:hypothetical protein [Ignavibacteriales bacterium]
MVYDKLIESGIEANLANDVKCLLDDCELMRFAPVDGKRKEWTSFTTGHRLSSKDLKG